MHSELQELLNVYREQRAFDPEAYIAEKSSAINEFFTRTGLKTGVIALSGGIDSAVVAGLLKTALDSGDEGLQRIVAVTTPSLNWDGMADQEETVVLAQEIADKLELELMVTPITEASEVFMKMLDPYGKQNQWLRGQVSQYLRGSFLYAVTAIMSVEGQPGVVCGTTNLDEGGYLGFLGKASDGLVDLEIIDDLHKSEVNLVAEALGLPESVLRAVPKPDGPTGESDEDWFGAPYEIVELSRAIRNGELSLDVLGQEALTEYEGYESNLQKVEAANKHKYYGDVGTGYAASLQILPCAVVGGWQPYNVLGML